jgi:hypothetical protein
VPPGVSGGADPDASAQQQQQRVEAIVTTSDFRISFLFLALEAPAP